MLLSFYRSKKRSWIFPVLILSIVLVGVISAVYMSFTVNNINRKDLIDRVNTIAQSIDYRDILALSASEEDLGNPSYIKIKDLIYRVRQVNSDVRFIYLNGITNNELFFYVDSEDSSSDDYSPPGETYPEATQLMHDIFVTKKNGFETASDRWGLWTSVYVPILNPETQTVVALLGMDVAGFAYILDSVAYGILPLLLMAMVIILLVVLKKRFDKEQYYIDQKAEFLSIASHEIRTPLTGIRWAAERIIKSNSNSFDKESKGRMLLIHENCVGLINRINNLLSVTVLEGKRAQELKKEFVLIKPLIEEIVQSLKLSALSRFVDFNLSNFPTGLRINCDPEKIRQVLTNLISNAVKYTKNNTSVKISYSRNKNIHSISITDQGKGIDEAEQKMIFKGFHRTLDAKDSDQFGSGLGLYLVDRITKLHGGTITVKSKLGEGSTFTLNLKD